MGAIMIGEPSVRQRLLNRLDERPVWDLLVVGGGATGLGVALQASLRGYSVLLVESHDFASGTSSRSTKLLHGGVRYLAQGNVSLVREALAQRRAVMAMAPHLTQALPFVMPAHRAWELPFYGIGLKLYDLLAGPSSLGPTQWLGSNETLEALPGIRGKDLWGGVRYWDAQFDDARLALELALTAEHHGALVINHMKATSLGAVRSGVREIALQDQRTRQSFEVRARCVVNATGVWVDELRWQDMGARAPGTGQLRLVSPSQGVHLVVDRVLFPTDHAMLIPRTRDGRVLFAVPWLGSVLLGTTDTPREDLPHEPVALKEEVDFILEEASAVFCRPVTRADVRSQWVGLRPLVNPAALKSHAASGAGARTGEMSREHTISVGSGGLVTVTGGKWTTFRVMANDTLEACIQSGALARKPIPPQGADRLIGSSDSAHANEMAKSPVSGHAWGGRVFPVTQEDNLGHGLTRQMVQHMAQHEHALTVEDVLARRCRLLFTDAAAALDLAAPVAGVLQRETGADVDPTAFEGLCKTYLGQVYAP
jgi:glycerol-3-phosphate dehydrogenase